MALLQKTGAATPLAARHLCGGEGYPASATEAPLSVRVLFLNDALNTRCLHLARK